ncbi:hypothetical protein DFR24_2122 [Panacagrimonas perspica]|uniref:Transglutaminase superfamily protein n=1 Tax=Panacagrimonas perspica TaxID=381431 RepID=A0A4R7PG10_9GAMM|nr:hypothetical protein [Panacagrimonas perspica]TDU32722.1 hypothetical protein DFR24_2122 [Panacagrimonas perspica]THD05602.1 hypothetical protein B1810_02480 [Panacagrimonas perspica]
MSIPSKPSALPFHRIARALLATFAILSTPSHAHETVLPQLPGMTMNSLNGVPQARYVRTSDRDGQLRVTADFADHDGEALRLSFSMHPEASLASMQAFGFKQAELTAMHQACMRDANCSPAEFDQRMKRYYREHALRAREIPGKPTRLSVDIPTVVRRNRAQVQPLVAALRQLGSERGLETEGLMAAATALVQGGLAYRAPAALEDGRETLGFYTPPRALEKGYGDCDTKSALLAAIFANLGEERIIGVGVPNHYLLGVARQPRDGEMSVEYRGEPYVLIEAAGPAQRRLGDVSKQTRVAFAEGQEIRIDPIF